ncbi:bifunctional diaminohydroxyphosphoribosylaminopyrimidine deaminase/5-amino-6-(5-phosphoribosylamino)uracil reductase RibD [Rhodothalassium salexigens]|uniref:bifunctional diaminohydroxyphosphoribosylaminopyrimidine deaminase/5-amino-6-(5-phosphoribosylamino)uracil reductase RibD n=1 Tax=Rhodothalassium salexigens TaxID=1086 RepID=UPI0019114173
MNADADPPTFVPARPDDSRHMAHALALARRGLGRTAPNPAVGCVLVRDGAVVGRGWTRPGGRPHAERIALDQAGSAARGATAYVTLEPCAHHGRTPPCADALVAAGIARAVVAIEDPDPRTAGRGLARLAAAGVALTLGVGAEAARAVGAGFLTRVTCGRPLVTLKLATSLDGRIALANGQSQWITGSQARRRGHLLRAQHDAILVGSGTALADDPALTVRLAGLEDRSPVRVLLDRRGRFPGPLGAGARLFDGTAPTLLVTESAPGPLPPGVARLDAPDPGDLHDVLRQLAARGITRLLVEGGGTVHAAFARAGLVDRIVWFRAAGLIGGDGVAGVGPLDLDALADMPRFACVDRLDLGGDTLETYVKAEA